MKFKRLDADARIFHGTKAQAPTTDANKAPRRILTYFGRSVVTSLAKLIELADTLQQTCARSQMQEQAKEAKRPPGVVPQELTMVSGFQTYAP